jgi:Fur family transcriptional regulator, ferric uptake regulator
MATDDCMGATHSHAPESSRESLAELTARLRHGSRRVTGPRQAILNVLRQERRPLTVRKIRENLTGTRCDLATIYRSLGMLTELGLVKRFDFGDGSARFELIGEGGASHHHHLVCNRCTRIVELAECFPEELEESIARQNGFHSVTHRLEFFGLCPSCQ